MIQFHPMKEMERFCYLLTKYSFYSNSGAKVDLAIDNHEKPWVRKTEGENHYIDIKRETSQSVAVFLDHVQFKHGARLVATTQCSETCLKRCVVSPFIDGLSLNDILGEDNSGIQRVAQLRLMLIESMKAGGYFNQQKISSPSAFYQWKFIEDSHLLSYLKQSNHLQICGTKIDDVSHEAGDFLCHGDFMVPMGIFPNDLNVTNILFRENDQEIRVIDQRLSWMSSGASIAKMIIGWRGLATLIPKKPNWCERNLESLYGNIAETKKFDEIYLQRFFSYYNWMSDGDQSNLVKEIAALQILKTFITLNKYIEQDQFPPQEIVDLAIGPFFHDSVSSFY